MKKRFEIAVAFIMVVVLCLALTGCGQNTSKPATSNNDVTQPDVGGGENHVDDATATQEPTAPSAIIIIMRGDFFLVSEVWGCMFAAMASLKN